MSYIPRQIKHERDTLNIRLDREVRETLDQYTAFLESGRDYVIGQVLRVVFAKDKEFQEWRSTHTATSSEQGGAGRQSDARGSTGHPRRRRPSAELITAHGAA